jgi:large subunit ribosomal protein L25
MSVAELYVELREKAGHHTSKSLRKQGIIPGVFYAHGEDSINISMNEKVLNQLLHTEVTILDIVFPDGNIRKSIFREIQRDPVTDVLIHVDIMGIKLTEKIKMSIPIILTGTPAGVKEGGILEHTLREIMVEGLPLDIPEHIEVDVSHLNIGDHVILEEIPEEKIKFVTEIHHTIAQVIHPRVVEEVVEEEEELEEAVGEEEAGAEEEAEDTASKDAS